MLTVLEVLIIINKSMTKHLSITIPFIITSKWVLCCIYFVSVLHLRCMKQLNYLAYKTFILIGKSIAGKVCAKYTVIVFEP